MGVNQLVAGTAIPSKRNMMQSNVINVTSHYCVKFGKLERLSQMTVLLIWLRKRLARFTQEIVGKQAKMSGENVVEMKRGL